MMLYAWVKWVHIVSSTVLMGTGIGIAFFLWMAHRSKDAAQIFHTARIVVIADTIFTAPAVVVQLGTGLWLAHMAGIPLGAYWIKSALGLFFFVGMCWLPVVWLQIHARNLARKASEDHLPLPRQYFTTMRWWFALGWPAFGAMLLIFYLMVQKPGG